MSTNPTVKLPITNDLRAKVLQKFTTLHSKLQTATPPEQLERSCFEKANNDQDTYIKLCNNLVSNRTKQLENSKNNVVGNQVRAVLNSNFRSNIVGQISNGVVSDPINALQNLTVTAGQPTQMNLQHPNQQINYRMNQQGMISMNSNAQMQQRIMVPANRPMDQFSIQQQQQQQQQLSQSPNPQMMPSQIQLHAINSMNVVNSGNSIRLINKNPSMKQDQIIIQNQNMQPTTYQMDSNGGQITSQQHMANVMHPSIVRSPVNRMVSGSPVVLSQHQSSPQERYVLSNQISQTITLVPTNSNTQSEEVVQSQNSLQNNNNTTNTPTPQNVPTTKSPMSEEETIKVKEELTRLSSRYFRYLKLAVDNPLNTDLDTIKIWTVLKGILDSSKQCDKPITLKHVAKIQLFSEKAENHVLSNNLDPTRIQGAQTNSEGVFGRRIIPDRSTTAFGCEPQSTSSNIDISSGPNHTNSLDVAFDDIIHQIKKQKMIFKRRVRDNLIKYIRAERKDCLHYLPKTLQGDPEQMELKEMEGDYDEHEFDFIDEESDENDIFRVPFNKSNNNFDENGLLRTDREWSYCIISDSVDVNIEMDLLSSEFEIIQLEPQIQSEGWMSSDSDLENGRFFSIKLRNNDNFLASVPPIIIRIPEDYDQSSSADWNLNLQQYPPTVTCDADLFLSDVAFFLKDEFSNLSSNPWNSVSLMDIIKNYKRGIIMGYSNYTNRNLSKK